MDAPLQGRGDYFRLMNVNGAARVYREALDAGLLEGLAKGSATAAALAELCGTLEGPTRLVLEVLVTLGVAQERGGSYVLTPLAAMLLSGAYRTLGDPYWDHLGTHLRTGRPLVTMDARAQSEGFYRAQAAALGWMLAPAAEAAAEALAPERLAGEVAILDVGAGAAGWSLALVRRQPRATVTALDWPAVLQVAVESAARLGLSERLRTLAGDYHRVDLPPDAFDLALLANVTHLETLTGNRALFARVHRALKPGGRIVILDVFPGQAEGDVSRTLYALGLALRTQSGQVHGRAALEAVLAEAGFVQPQLLPLPVPPFTMAALVAGRPTSS